jgi:hypothetical protein
VPTELELFRNHCAHMADAWHSQDCVAESAQKRSRWQHLNLFGEWLSTWGPRPTEPPTYCPGRVCISDADRDLFRRLAAEVDTYLHTDDPDALFPATEKDPNHP